MRRLTPLALLFVVALLTAGCGRKYTPPPKPTAKPPQPPMVVAQEWVRATDKRLVGVGARLFAPNARVPEGRLKNQTQAGTWIQATACSGRLVSASQRANRVTLTLRATKGPNRYCPKPGERFRVGMTVRRGKIVSLEYL